MADHRRYGWVILVAGLLASWPLAPALAHKLKVFATATGADITGAVYFVGGGPAAEAVVRIEAPPGAVPIEIRTDQAGRFSLRARLRADHLIIADAGDGHTGRIHLAAALLPEALPAVPGSPAAATPSAEAAPPPSPTVPAVPVDPGQLRDAVAEAVASQIRPLREELDRYRDEVRLRDILGGVGWIIGLAGIALWARAGRRGAGG